MVKKNKKIVFVSSDIGTEKFLRLRLRAKNRLFFSPYV